MIAWTHSWIRRLELNCTCICHNCGPQLESARKWFSNVPDVLECIQRADCVTEVDLDRKELPLLKTLGVLWSASEDEFRYQVHQPSRDHSNTKRAVLKKIATLFDPFGF